METEMQQWYLYLIVLGGLGALFFASAVYALFWAVRNGQLRNFEKGAKTIFDDEEPEGQQTDFFPGKGEKSSAIPHGRQHYSEQ